MQPSLSPLDVKQDGDTAQAPKSSSEALDALMGSSFSSKQALEEDLQKALEQLADASDSRNYRAVREAERQVSFARAALRRLEKKSPQSSKTPVQRSTPPQAKSEIAVEVKEGFHTVKECRESQPPSILPVLVSTAFEAASRAPIECSPIVDSKSGPGRALLRRDVIVGPSTYNVVDAVVTRIASQLTGLVVNLVDGTESELSIQQASLQAATSVLEYYSRPPPSGLNYNAAVDLGPMATVIYAVCGLTLAEGMLAASKAAGSAPDAISFLRADDPDSAESLRTAAQTTTRPRTWWACKESATSWKETLARVVVGMACPKVADKIKPFDSALLNASLMHLHKAAALPLPKGLVSTLANPVVAALAPSMSVGLSSTQKHLGNNFDRLVQAHSSFPPLVSPRDFPQSPSLSTTNASSGATSTVAPTCKPLITPGLCPRRGVEQLSAPSLTAKKLPILAASSLGPFSPGLSSMSPKAPKPTCSPPSLPESLVKFVPQKRGNGSRSSSPPIRRTSPPTSFRTSKQNLGRSRSGSLGSVQQIGSGSPKLITKNGASLHQTLRHRTSSLSEKSKTSRLGTSQSPATFAHAQTPTRPFAVPLAVPLQKLCTEFGTPLNLFSSSADQLPKKLADGSRATGTSSVKKGL